ncbi:fructose-1,6-bisphosphatase class 1/Sedoheputulose-1,7-bisphosphatase [Schizothecium vesticola]|uniref:Fructose-1,6-bisphosphatase class 1/Sedoheputulose-1,7-bisphosphatase n=1 Tax=Schizothecium vesticola TaxID=314040 RepID=A0AA40K2G1_9PEZI|nr:fructose-1,6-bisphosphatase class 1/Sedoheputulose-1,7-bisphosphatase [Schizothecium vesticola]
MDSTPPFPLTSHLTSLIPNRPALRDSVLPALLTAISQIALALRTASVHTSGTSNTFGDAQLNVDVLAESHIRAALLLCPSIHTASSEEDPVERPVHPVPTAPGPEAYTLAFDPLDGSSIIGPNFTVGTILSLWDHPTSALHLPPATSQIAAILGVYGPRTTAIIALRLPGTQGTAFEVSLPSMTVTVPRILLSLPPVTGTRYFAPANLRAAAEDPRYMVLVTHYIRERYTLRYSGGLVPDVVHALVKGHGVYVSPVTAGSGAKLRRLYETCPVALVVECAGGGRGGRRGGGDIEWVKADGRG